MTVDLLHVGECQVVLAPLEETAVLPIAIEAAVAAEWNAECAQRPGLFNGVLLSALQASAGRLLVRRSEYRHFIAQRRQPQLADQLRVNPVAVSGLVVTSDHRWLFGRRGAGVTQYPLHLEAIPSGTLDERAFAGQLPKTGLVLDPLSCLLAELSEEAGIEREAVDQVRPLGLFLDVEEQTYDLAYLVRLRRSAADLQAQLAAADGSFEYHHLQALRTDEVSAVMAQASVVPTTRRLWATWQDAAGERNP